MTGTLEYRRKLAVNGLGICCGCKKEKPINEFHKQNNRHTSRCKECSSVVRRKHWSENRSGCKDKNKEWMVLTRVRVMQHYSGKTIPECACCGEYKYEFLAIDHINGGGGEHRKELGKGNKGGNRVFIDLHKKGYPLGYRVLCHNCNSALGFYGYCPHNTDTVIKSRHQIALGVISNNIQARAL